METRLAAKRKEAEGAPPAKRTRSATKDRKSSGIPPAPPSTRQQTSRSRRASETSGERRRTREQSSSGAASPSADPQVTGLAANPPAEAEAGPSTAKTSAMDRSGRRNSRGGADGSQGADEDKVYLLHAPKDAARHGGGGLSSMN